MEARLRKIIQTINFLEKRQNVVVLIYISVLQKGPCVTKRYSIEQLKGFG